MFFIPAETARRRAAASALFVGAGLACAGAPAADMLPLTANDVLGAPVHSPFAGGTLAVDSATLSATVALQAASGGTAMAPPRLQTLRERLALAAAEIPRGQVYPAGTLDHSERLRSPAAPPAAAALGNIGVTLPRNLAHPDRIGVNIALNNTTSAPGTVILTPLGPAPGR